MSKKLLTLFLFIMLIGVYGCESEAERIAEQERLLDEKIITLTQVAEGFYDEGKVSKSLETYEEIYSLQNSEEVNIKIDTLKNEINNVKQAHKFIDGLYDIQKSRLRSGISVSASDFEYIMKDIKFLIEDFEALDTSEDNSINQFINQIKGDDSYRGYSYLKEEANNTVYEDGGTTDAVSALDSNFGVFATSFIALNRDWVLQSIENVLTKKIPNKYDEVINE